MKIAFVGTGFVADYYMATLPNHPRLALAGAFDRVAERLRAFCDFHAVEAYDSLDALLADPEIGIVANLTTPESHYDVSRRALAAGKHVYSEKPLAMDLGEARSLVDMASRAGLTIAAAPANGLSDAHRLVAASLHEIGEPRLVYAEMEDGPVFRDKWATWRSRSGAPWPGRHEFEVGCTLEHAGYALSWLVSLFGPVESLTAFSQLSFPDKGPGTRDIAMAPDFSVGCLRFRSGVVARLTSGLAAPRDRSLTILATEGSITVEDLWDDRSAVRIERLGEPRSSILRLASRAEARMGRFLSWKPAPGRRLRYRAPRRGVLPAFPSQIDFALGIAEQASAIEAREAPFFSGHRALHITEIALALNNASNMPQPYRLESTF